MGRTTSITLQSRPRGAALDSASTMAATVATSGATSMALTASQTRSVRPRRSPNCNFAFSTIRAIFLTLVTSHPCRSTSPSSCSSSLAPVAAATRCARHLVERRLGERGVGQQRRGLGCLLALRSFALDGPPCRTERCLAARPVGSPTRGRRACRCRCERSRGCRRRCRRPGQRGCYTDSCSREALRNAAQTAAKRCETEVNPTKPLRISCVTA